MSEPARETAGITTAVIVRYVRSHGGDGAVEQMLSSAGESRPVAELEDEAVWSTYEQKIALFQAAAQVLQDRLVARHIGETALESNVGGALKLMLWTLGSPQRVLRRIPKTARRLSGVCTVDAREVERNRAVVTYRLHDELAPNRLDCDYNIGLLSQVPVLFGLRPAAVVHDECQVRGAPECVYRLRWTARSRLPWRARKKRFADLEGQLTSLGERTEALESTTADLISPDEIETVLARIAQRAANAVRARSYVLAVHPAPDSALQIHHAGLAVEEAEEIARELEGERRTGDFSDSRLVVEVVSARRRYGHLVALNPERDSFFPEEETLLRAYGRHAAAALDVATSLEEARTQGETARVLLDLARSLASGTTTDDVAQRLAAAVPKVISVDRASVLLWDERSRTLSYRGFFGYPKDLEEMLHGMTHHLEETPHVEDVVADRPGPSIEETTVDRVVRKMMESYGAGEVVVVPISARGQFLGVIAATRQSDRPRFDVHETLQARMSGLADEAATALQNARLLEQERAVVQRLQEADRMKSEFLAVVSHELRTPLSVIIGAAKTLERRGNQLEEPVREEFVGTLLKRGEQLQRLVEDLLEASRSIVLRPDLVDLSDLGRAAVTDARKLRTDCTIDFKDGTPVEVIADPGRLRQVVDNLLTNAIKYAPGAAVGVYTGRDDDAAWLRVTDDGPGMTSEQLEKAFDRFYQADGSEQRTSGGIGLGLYICRRIAEAHGGTIQLQSELGEGTEAILRLPLVEERTRPHKEGPHPSG
ncbi:MAG: ATP-binding protein [Actinomycetota bacterium]|nr:ATP-binding protein [Actinomycetota bacterium]